jgi:hypothetical protein
MTRLITLRGFHSLALALAMLTAQAHATETPPPLTELLRQTSRSVLSLMEQFSEVKCTEAVTQTKLSKDGKPEYSEDSRFDYLVMIQGSSDDLLFDESRLEEKQARRSKNLPLLLTNGFSTMFLIFHPYYLKSFEFSLLGEEVVAGRRVMQLGFRHLNGTRTPSALLLRERQYPLSLAGTAWIDAATGALMKVEATLENNLEDVGLKNLKTEVVYAPVRLPGVSQQHWLPATATIEVETQKQRWRNQHRFLDYKVFSVSTEETPATVTQ